VSLNLFSIQNMTTQNVASVYPLPPEYYKRYTDENLSILKQVKEQGEEAFVSSGGALPQTFNILELEPPPPITEGYYYTFNEPWPVGYYPFAIWTCKTLLM
jgi:mediator of RNA polymerase II transcription subunit 7